MLKELLGVEVDYRTANELSKAQINMNFPTTHGWMPVWKKLFLASLDKVPENAVLSFSAGIDSSAILFGLHELDKTPKQMVTFMLEGYPESSDLKFSRKIADDLRIELLVAKIPNVTTFMLQQDLHDIIAWVPKIRSIDIQVCYAYKYMLEMLEPGVPLVMGMYPELSYHASDMTHEKHFKMARKGLISWRELYEYEKHVEDYWKWNDRSNYKVIGEYIESKGHQAVMPFKDEELFYFSRIVGFWPFHFNDELGKWNEKYFLTHHMFERMFSKYGNAKNKKNFHTNGHLKEYFIERLCPDGNYKKIITAFNQIANRADDVEDMGDIFEDEV